VILFYHEVILTASNSFLPELKGSTRVVD